MDKFISKNESKKYMKGQTKLHIAPSNKNKNIHIHKKVALTQYRLRKK